MDIEIQNSYAIGGLSLAANIILGAHSAIDNAGQSLKFWDNAAIFNYIKALRKRPRVEALLEEIRGQYVEYFPVNTHIVEIYKAIREISSAILDAHDCYKRVYGNPVKLGGSPELSPVRLGVNYCGEMETAIFNASLTYACYKIGDAAYMAGNVENVIKIWDGEQLPKTERVQVEAIRADALAALEPVRQKYGLIFPIAQNIEQADALTDQYDMEYSGVLKQIWKTSGVDII